MDTRPLSVTRNDAWAIHDCLQAVLAGFSGRHESAEPWHATNLLAKLRPALLLFEGHGAPTAVDLELNRGELECIDLNVPRTAYHGATDLLLRVFHALEELAWEMPVLRDDPEDASYRVRLASWRGGYSDTNPNEEGGDPV